MARYVANPAGIKEMLASPAMVEAMRRKAEQMKGYAEVIAPVDTGEYKASFHATAGVQNGAAYGRLSNSADHAIFVEFAHRVHNSTRVVAGQHILARSLDALRLP